ncbi:transposase, partial [Brevibacillus sp. LEMMJ03]
MQSVEDVQSALKELFAETLQEMLEAELETSLGYAKHDTKNKKTTNSRNGYSKKKV